ncbi:prolipoprotein diacylglyceryl transferase [Halococcoides cellulosivorans]|uniref:hypothetical protein n=1 Tax=Halococcoides cellulosivorans TaxID=1679096 RepID=UPI00131F02CB|nr:hypothetical protein [Halococcoides cellulosivorans]
MSLEAFPDTVDIVDSNFKTSQQQEAAETIADNWPVDLDRLVEEGDHVRVFYRRVIEQFLGPAGADMTFAEIETEYGDVADWPGPDGDGEEPADESSGVSDAEAAAAAVAASADAGEQAQTEAETPTAEAETPTAEAETPTAEAETDGIAAADQVESPSSERSSIGDAGIEAALGERSDDVDDQRRAWFASGFREGILFALENPHLVRDR